MRRHNHTAAVTRVASLAILAVCACLVLAASPADAAELSINLPAQVQVSGNTCLVADVAEYASGDQELWVAIAAETIAYAPDPGKSFKLAAKTLLGRLKERGYNWQAIELTGADVVVITGSQQTVDSGPVRELIEAQAALKLGVPVKFAIDKPLPTVDLPGGELEITVRFPDKPGEWLPDAVEYTIGERLVERLVLSHFGEFELPVVVAADTIDGRTRLKPDHLIIGTQSLRPGTEVVTDPASIEGLKTKMRFSAGSPLKLSKLEQPFDVERGSYVLLVIRGGAVELNAQAVALNGAYLGQTIAVERMSDGMRFTGVVEDGPVVIVE